MARTEIQMTDADNTFVDDSADIRASVAASMRGEVTEPAGEGAAPDPVVPSAEASAERPADTRPRGPDGKFIDKDAVSTDPKATDKPVDKPADKTTETPDPKASGEAQAKVSPGVPDTLTAEDKAAFQKLTPEAQQIVARREAHWNQTLSAKGRELAQVKHQFGEIDQVLGPYRPQMQKMGLTEAQGLRQLFGLRDFAVSNPLEFAKDWIKQHNIDPTTLLPKQAGEPEYVDPELKKINDRLSTFEQQKQEEAAQREQAATAETTKAIQLFQTAADDKGNPRYPHAQKLWSLMIPIAAQIRQQHPDAAQAAILHVAYGHAERQHPETHELLVEKKRQEWEAARTAKQLEEEQKRQKEQQQKVKDATRSAGSVTGSPGPGSAAPAQGSESVEDDIRASIRALRAG